MGKSTLTVHVHYFSILADYVLAKDADLTVNRGISVDQFLAYLMEINPPTFKALVMDGVKRTSFVRIFRNGELVAGENEQALVAEGDEYRLFPAISGG
ncbi:MAG: MoaD/ThiS family protein [Anaerolineaceae bacterium]|nr:MoaD/ThiS family protein [Anaerolineaceae bacterium]